MLAREGSFPTSGTKNSATWSLFSKHNCPNFKFAYQLTLELPQTQAHKRHQKLSSKKKVGFCPAPLLFCPPWVSVAADFTLTTLVQKVLRKYRMICQISTRNPIKTAASHRRFEHSQNARFENAAFDSPSSTGRDSFPAQQCVRALLLSHHLGSQSLLEDQSLAVWHLFASFT